MNIFSLEELKKTAEDALKGTGAFLRVSRNEGLFVTDASRHGVPIEQIIERLPGFVIREEGGLCYLTPGYGFTDEINDACTQILKSEKEKREKLIRTNLASAMRKKDPQLIKLFQTYYERMISK